ncbi:MAG TPA: lytic transglycosylase domain-containing protein [Thermoanaerobaculia bacterium]
MKQTRRLLLRIRKNRAESAAAAALVGAALLTGIFREDSNLTTAADALRASAPLEYLAGALEAGSTAASGEQEWDLANIDHDRVDYWIERFTTDKRSDFAIWLARKGQHQEMIATKLAERNMPQDLVYLAMIESGFNPKAYSHAHASGIWQFIPETGQRYGLTINRAIDERNDPARATDAALAYLSDLHDRFGSWYLAAASYNTGENRVGRIMRETTGSERGSDSDYYLIWDRLPRETRDYVPLMIAAARIGKERAKYGFDTVEPRQPLAYVEMTVAPATPLATIARTTGTTVDAILQVNPHFKLERTRNDMASVVRIPREAAS